MHPYTPYISPHLDQLGPLLLQIEADTHRNGWDQKAHVRMIYDNTDHQLDRNCRKLHVPGPNWPHTRKGNLSAVTIVPIGGLEASMAPWEAWRNLAINLAYATDEEPSQILLAILRAPGIVALAVVHEAWFNADRVASRQAIRKKVSLGDIPGSLDARSVFACDITRKFHRVSRIRGRKPELISDIDEQELAGDFTTSMKIIMDAVHGTVVPIDALPDVYPTLAARMDSGSL